MNILSYTIILSNQIKKTTLKAEIIKLHILLNSSYFPLIDDKLKKPIVVSRFSEFGH